MSISDLAIVAALDIAPSKELIKELAEFTLALVLFSDASRVGLHELRVDAGRYVRLLGVALPLTIGLGTLLALALGGGATAEPLAARDAKLLAHRAAEGPGALMPDMPDRRLIRRSPALRG
jgi:sodium/hydrogen antiporter